MSGDDAFARSLPEAAPAGADAGVRADSRRDDGRDSLDNSLDNDGWPVFDDERHASRRAAPREEFDPFGTSGRESPHDPSHAAPHDADSGEFGPVLDALPQDDDTTATEAPTSPIGPMPDMRGRGGEDRGPRRGDSSRRGDFGGRRGRGRRGDRADVQGNVRDDIPADDRGIRDHGSRDHGVRDHGSRDDGVGDEAADDRGAADDRVARDDRPPSRRGGDRPEMHGVHHFFSPERLEECQHAIGYHFRDVSLLENALTHSSIKSDDRPSYERLEFLGDSVVGLVIAAYLYDKAPEFDEGELTKVKSMVVSTDGLANAALAIGLDRFLAMGRGLLMKQSIPRSLIADVFEGVVGAVFLDRGYETARLYVLDHLIPYIDRALTGNAERNYKSVLQQIAQRELRQTPHYDVMRESGSEGHRVFEVAAVLGRRRFPAGRAATKREAEQAAAKIAIQLILIEKRSSGRRRGR